MSCSSRLWCMDPSRGSLYGFGSVFEGLACRTSFTRRVATISQQPGTGSRPGRIMTAVWFGAAISVSGLTKALWRTGTRVNDGHLAVNGGLRKRRFPRRCCWEQYSDCRSARRKALCARLRIGTRAAFGGDRVKGRMNWQKRHDYGLRALDETAMARVKRRNGGKLTARTFQSQQNEIAIQIGALNRSIRAAKPNTIRIR